MVLNEEEESVVMSSARYHVGAPDPEDCGGRGGQDAGPAPPDQVDAAAADPEVRNVFSFNCNKKIK